MYVEVPKWHCTVVQLARSSCRKVMSVNAIICKLTTYFPNIHGKKIPFVDDQKKPVFTSNRDGQGISSMYSWLYCIFSWLNFLLQLQKDYWPFVQSKAIGKVLRHKKVEKLFLCMLHLEHPTFACKPCSSLITCSSLIWGYP